MPQTGFDIYQQLHDPGDTTGLDAMGSGCGQLRDIHNDVAEKLSTSQTTLNTFWKGQAADTGSAGLSPLINTSRTAAQKMDTMRQSIEEQSSAFTFVKNNVVNVDQNRPDDDTVEDWLSIGASNDEIKAAQFDNDTHTNVELYDRYHQSSQPRTDTMPADYPAAHDPNVSAGGVTPNPIDVGTSGGKHVSSSSDHSGGSHISGPSSYTAPPGAAGYKAPAPPGHSSSGAYTPPVVPAANDSTSAAFAGPTQTPGGPGSPSWQGPGTGINGPGGGNSSGFGPGFGPVGGFGGGGGFGSGGGSRGGFGPGGGSGFGPGGGGASSGGAAGMGRGVGAGAGTGAGALGEGAGAARPGGMGAAGAKGQPGMGGMGAGGAKGGKGPEDEEHQRKILLSEEDPDSIFGGYDGDKPTPPVIGA
ncbi:hypothetical protein ACQPXB_48945 [Amycolatopsis sp. CA-161197]|uniref:hypothetical protein n=1 Tax=Amycolatopsis sp. CA-161197 TaxID=3239922 RepID=UPI003D8F4154